MLNEQKSSKKRKIKIAIKKDRWKLTTNSSFEDKIKVRKHVLNALDVENPMVLDVYCAKGEMWKDAYNKTKNYVGLDLERFDDERNTVVCDNTRYLRMADLDQFDIFDLDAFGSPFNCLAIIAHRLTWKNKDKVGIVLTDGTGLNSRLNAMNREFLNWIGAKAHMQSKVQMNHREDFIVAGILKAAEICQAHITDLIVAYKNKKSQMRYISYVMHKKHTKQALRQALKPLKPKAMPRHYHQALKPLGKP